jgi:hypothetical protein
MGNPNVGIIMHSVSLYDFIDYYYHNHPSGIDPSTSNRRNYAHIKINELYISKIVVARTAAILDLNRN